MTWRALLPGEAQTIATACVTFDPYKHLGYRAETLAIYLTLGSPDLPGR